MFDFIWLSGIDIKIAAVVPSAGVSGSRTPATLTQPAGGLRGRRSARSVIQPLALRLAADRRLAGP